MHLSDIPVKVPTPWASDAPAANVDTIPPTSSVPGRASWQQGFPSLNFISEDVGGIPPFGQDTNGVLLAVTAWLKWQNAGGPVQWDVAFAAAIGGYPQGALLSSNPLGTFWLSTVDNNVTNPDASGAGWVSAFLSTGSAAGGDLGGTYPNPSVTHIQGIPVSATTPTASQALLFNGSQYVPGAVGGAPGPPGPVGPAGPQGFPAWIAGVGNANLIGGIGGGLAYTATANVKLRLSYNFPALGEDQAIVINGVSLLPPNTQVDPWNGDFDIYMGIGDSVILSTTACSAVVSSEQLGAPARLIGALGLSSSLSHTAAANEKVAIAWAVATLTGAGITVNGTQIVATGDTTNGMTYVYLGLGQTITVATVNAACVVSSENVPNSD